MLRDIKCPLRGRVGIWVPKPHSVALMRFVAVGEPIVCIQAASRDHCQAAAPGLVRQTDVCHIPPFMPP